VIVTIRNGFAGDVPVSPGFVCGILAQYNSHFLIRQGNVMYCLIL